MKAALITKPGTLVVETVADPVPGPYDAVCEILFGATCTGTDSHILDGTFPWISKFPTILGHESIGRVVAVGSKVRHYKAGDLVTRVGAPDDVKGGYSVTWGGFATLGLARDHWAMRRDGLPESEWKGARWNQIIPTGIDPAEATMIITWRETLSFLRRIGVRSGAKVLVMGTGGVGLAFVTMAKNLGAGVVAAVGSAARMEVSRSAGATHVADYRHPEWNKSFGDAAPAGFDIVIDAIGKPEPVLALAGLVAEGGTFAAYGMDNFNDYRLNPRWCRSIRIYNGGYDEEETHQSVIDWMRAGRLDARLWIDPAKAYPLARIAEAYQSLARREAVKHCNAMQ